MAVSILKPPPGGLPGTKPGGIALTWLGLASFLSAWAISGRAVFLGKQFIFNLFGRTWLKKTYYYYRP